MDLGIITIGPSTGQPLPADSPADPVAILLTALSPGDVVEGQVVPAGTAPAGTVTVQIAGLTLIFPQGTEIPFATADGALFFEIITTPSGPALKLLPQAPSPPGLLKAIPPQIAQLLSGLPPVAVATKPGTPDAQPTAFRSSAPPPVPQAAVAGDTARIADALTRINAPPSAENIEIVRALLSREIPATRENFDSVRTLTAQFASSEISFSKAPATAAEVAARIVEGGYTAPDNLPPEIKAATEAIIKAAAFLRSAGLPETPEVLSGVKSLVFTPREFAERLVSLRTAIARLTTPPAPPGVPTAQPPSVNVSGTVTTLPPVGAAASEVAPVPQTPAPAAVPATGQTPPTAPVPAGTPPAAGRAETGPAPPASVAPGATPAPLPATAVEALLKAEILLARIPTDVGKAVTATGPVYIAPSTALEIATANATEPAQLSEVKAAVAGAVTAVIADNEILARLDLIIRTIEQILHRTNPPFIAPLIPTAQEAALQEISAILDIAGNEEFAAALREVIARIAAEGARAGVLPEVSQPRTAAEIEAYLSMVAAKIKEATEGETGRPETAARPAEAVLSREVVERLERVADWARALERNEIERSGALTELRDVFTRADDLAGRAQAVRMLNLSPVSTAVEVFIAEVPVGAGADSVTALLKIFRRRESERGVEESEDRPPSEFVIYINLQLSKVKEVEAKLVASPAVAGEKKLSILRVIFDVATEKVAELFERAAPRLDDALEKLGFAAEVSVRVREEPADFDWPHGAAALRAGEIKSEGFDIRA